MKKIKIEGKLSLNKQTVAKLDSTEMIKVKGGAWPSNTWQSNIVCAPSSFCPSGTTGCTGALSGCAVC